MSSRLFLIWALGVALCACSSGPEANQQTAEAASPAEPSAPASTQNAEMTAPAATYPSYIKINAEGKPLLYRDLQSYDSINLVKGAALRSIQVPQNQWGQVMDIARHVRTETELYAAISPLAGMDTANARALARMVSTLPLSRNAKVPENWATPTDTAYNTPEAQMVYRYGDIDNLNFTFPSWYDPFSGEPTFKHSYPFYGEPDDPPGTDRIMVITGYKPGSGDTRKEGYSTTTNRKMNGVQPLQLRFPKPDFDVKEVVLQIFADDFQAPTFKNWYRVYANGQRLPYAEDFLNGLKQGGPIAKLVTINIPVRDHFLFTSGTLDLVIDDSLTHVGEGYAIDFVRLLFNPEESRSYALEGRVVSSARPKQGVPGALVVASSGSEAVTDEAGYFELDELAPGLVSLVGRHPKLGMGAASADIPSLDTAKVILVLEPLPKNTNALEEQLIRSGRSDLYGVNFNFNKADILPESEEELRRVREVLAKHRNWKVQILGHTDNVGSSEQNKVLSERRAQAVVSWLTEHGIESSTLAARGYGETRPIADNETEEGRALNRRVEIRVQIQ